jgi:hypothetical protein
MVSASPIFNKRVAAQSGFDGSIQVRDVTDGHLTGQMHTPTATASKGRSPDGLAKGAV